MAKSAYPIDPALTAIAIAYKNANYIADQVLPRIMVAKQEFTFLQYATDQNFNIPETRVGRRSKPNEVSLTAEEVTDSTNDEALDGGVPNSDIDNADARYDPLGIEVAFLQELIALARESRAADLVFSTGTYAAGLKATLVRGTFGWDFTAGAYPFLKLDMTGMLLLPTPIDTSAPGAPTLTQWKDPLEVNTDNTDLTLGGFALITKSFTGDANADIAMRNLVGARYVQRGNHAITGKIVGEVPDLATKNYFDSLMSGAEIALDVTHGTVAGNIVEFSSAHLQVTDIDLSEENDVLMATISYGLNVGTTPDDLIITAK